MREAKPRAPLSFRFLLYWTLNKLVEEGGGEVIYVYYFLEALELEDEVDELELVALVDEDEEEHEDPHLSRHTTPRERGFAARCGGREARATGGGA